MADKVPVPVYFPRALYEWLVQRKNDGHGSLSQQAVTYCLQGRLRDEMRDALAEIEPDMPAGLEEIQTRIRDQERNP